MKDEWKDELVTSIISWRKNLIDMDCWLLSCDDHFLRILCRLIGCDPESEFAHYFFEVLRSDYTTIVNLQQENKPKKSAK